MCLFFFFFIFSLFLFTFMLVFNSGHNCPKIPFYHCVSSSSLNPVKKWSNISCGYYSMKYTNVYREHNILQHEQTNTTALSLASKIPPSSTLTVKNGFTLRQWVSCWFNAKMATMMTKLHLAREQHLQQLSIRQNKEKFLKIVFPFKYK